LLGYRPRLSIPLSLRYEPLLSKFHRNFACLVF
jgi:hypothetical protein